MQWRTRVVYRHATVQAGATVQGNGAHMALIQVLMDLE